MVRNFLLAGRPPGDGTGFIETVNLLPADFILFRSGKACGIAKYEVVMPIINLGI